MTELMMLLVGSGASGIVFDRAACHYDCTSSAVLAIPCRGSAAVTRTASLDAFRPDGVQSRRSAHVSLEQDAGQSKLCQKCCWFRLYHLDRSM